VFNRLLGVTSSGQNGAMSPAELLIALHNIDPAKCDMKTVIKATSICFQEKTIYTMEVLTIVLQQLMEQKVNIILRGEFRRKMINRRLIVL
jgi:symplekin